MAELSMGIEERRARLAVRHRLAARARAGDPLDVATSLVAIHSSDPATVILSIAARLRRPDAAAVERALYDERTLVRLHGMRRTLWVVPTEMVPAVLASSAQALEAAERRRTVALFEATGLAADGAAWLQELEAATVAALDRRGEAFAQELSADVPGLRRKMTYGEGTKWVGTQSSSTRVLFQLALEARIARGRPRGTWTGSQYRWAPMRAWLGGDPPRLDPAAARAELARRWLAAFGPATVADLKWWTGWTLAQVRTVLAAIDVTEVDLGGATGLVLAGDEAPTRRPARWVALLPGLDATVMGWAERDWYLGAHRGVLFDRNGNAGPTVWSDGRVVGGWAQRRDGEVVVRLLDDVGRAATAAIAAEAARLQAWLGPIKVLPRFRTPLERQLST